MAKYNKSIDEIMKEFHDYSREDEKSLLHQFANMGFPLEDEVFFNTLTTYDQTNASQIVDNTFGNESFSCTYKDDTPFENNLLAA